MNTFLLLLMSLFPIQDKPESSPEGYASSNPDQVTTYFFIRHAEKDSSDPTDKNPRLSPEGQKRAAAWGKVFQEVEFDLIFSTDYYRTKETAETVAQSQQKEVQMYDPRQLYNPAFQEQTKGKTVLVVGHSNTNPVFANRILQENRFQSIEEQEYGSLIMITVAPDGTKSSTLLYIN